MTLEILTHPALHPLRHGFFTRKGGASSGLFAGLNCGRGSSDQKEVVAINRARVAAALGLPPERLATVNQTHSDRVVTLTGTEDLDAVARFEADAIVTAVPGLAIAVLTADCQPVLFADAGSGVVGAAHGGWRGALDGILQATVAAMRDAGAGDIPAVIGPCISKRAYEVSEDFMDRFLIEDERYSRFFSGGPNGRPMFDLPGFGLATLRELGVEAEWIGHCTYSDPARFFSYRRATHEGAADYGRLISAIAL